MFIRFLKKKKCLYVFPVTLWNVATTYSFENATTRFFKKRMQQRFACTSMARSFCFIGDELEMAGKIKLYLLPSVSQTQRSFLKAGVSKATK